MQAKNHSEVSLESAIKNRATFRDLTGGHICKNELDRLVWAAYGNTHNDGRYKLRTAPSAGATFPVEIYLVVERVDGVGNGIYRHDSKSEKLKSVREGEFLNSICRESLDQDFIPLSNIAFILVYNPLKIVPRYGRDSRTYALLECGHIVQNIFLMTVALGLGAVPVGAFSRKRLGSIIGIDDDREVLYMICIGTRN